MNIEQLDAAAEPTARIVAAYISSNPVKAEDIPGLINNVHRALTGLGEEPTPEPEVLVPAVPIKKSVQPDYIVCLDDGMRFKSLKRHLSTHHNMTPDEYRARWGLPADYPLTAPNYSARRSELAKAAGLGRKRKSPKTTGARS